MMMMVQGWMLLIMSSLGGIHSQFQPTSQPYRLELDLYKTQSTQPHPRRSLITTELKFSGVDFQQVPLGAGYGTHYAELHFGVPPQKASVIVDTGSHLTAMPCKNCDDCGEHTDPPYDLKKSTTVKYMGCDAYGSCQSCDNKKCYISLRYSEGSMWKAIIVEDLCWLGSLDSMDNDSIMKEYGVRFPIGCQVKETGLFITQKANGIMGMSDNDKTIMKYLIDAGRIKRNQFSLCFGYNGGKMSVGGVDHSLHKGSPVYLPYTSRYSGWYKVRLLDIMVAGRSIKYSIGEFNAGKGCIVDSGTTDSFFPAAAKDLFDNVFKEVAGIDFVDAESMAIELSDAELDRLPVISIILEGMNGTLANLTIPAAQYFTLQSNGKYVGNFHFSEDIGAVLGASTMMNYNVIFDRDNKTVGFARAKCGPTRQKVAPPSPPRQETTRLALVFTVFLALVGVVGVLVYCLIKRQRRSLKWSKVSEDERTDRESEGEMLTLADNMSTRGEDHFTIGDEEDDDIALSPRNIVPRATEGIDGTNVDDEEDFGAIIESIVVDGAESNENETKGFDDIDI